VVILSQFSDPDYALALLQKGATSRAYLLKERISDTDQLVTTIGEVANGGSVIDPKVIEGLVAAKVRKPKSPLAELFLSERAVEKYINSVFSKLSLAEEKDAHRRVRAALLYLSEEKA
jgi:DNA-binding NarL/FixJ family response regulator